MTDFLQWWASHTWGRVLIGATIGLPIGYGAGSLAFNPYFQRWWADHWPLVPVLVVLYLTYPIWDERLKAWWGERAVRDILRRTDEEYAKRRREP